MIKLQPNIFTDSNGNTITSYKIGMANAFGVGMTVNDCIFGQFAMEPKIATVNYIDKQTHQPASFVSVKASIRWYNNDNPEMLPDNYSCFRLDLPAGLEPILKAQLWMGRFFMLYLEPFKKFNNKTQREEDRVRFKLVECDQNGTIYEVQPQPVYEQRVIPENRVMTPQYMPGHAPQKPVVQTPVHIQTPNANVQIGQNRMTAPQMVQARQQFVPPQPNFQATQMQQSATQQVAMQQNPVQPPQIRFGGVNMQQLPQQAQQPAYVPKPIQPVTMPPLPNSNVNQAPVNVPVPQPQMQTQPAVTSFQKFGLDANETEVLESLLNDPRLNDWKESANRSQEFFNEAIPTVVNFIQKPVREDRYQVMFECWNTL